MRYEYTITKETKDGGEPELMHAMSWKKLFKKLLMKYPKFSGWCTYMNKKGHLQQRSFRNGREILMENRPIECAICGCEPKPDEWSAQVENCCFDCA